jgi:hypothetical protein
MGPQKIGFLLHRKQSVFSFPPCKVPARGDLWGSVSFAHATSEQRLDWLHHLQGQKWLSTSHSRQSALLVLKVQDCVY